jgi:hypothetical protein
MKNLFTAIAIASLTTATFADVSITGAYEGTVTENTTTSNYEYSQDLDITVRGKMGDTTVTATFEDMTGGSTVTSKQVYMETKVIDGINFKGGNYKGQNGTGLLQKKSSATNKMKVSTDVAGFGVAVNQVSGSGTSTYDVAGKVGPADVTIQNATNDTRYITVSGELQGITVVYESQEASTGNTNMGVSASATVGGIDVTGVYVDVQDASGITQDDGILGDISDANADTTVTGIVASTGTEFGTVTGKYITKNDLNTMVGKIKVGDIEYGVSKTENADAVFDAKLTVTF